jgi:diacylglycerol kinase (ATP)
MRMTSSPRRIDAARPLARAVVVANPAADATTAALVETIAAECARHVGECLVHWTTGVADATAVAARQECDLIVGVGGDGTIREITEGLVTRPDPAPSLLALPGGSGNSFCRGLWGERDALQVLQTALDPARAHIRHADVLRVARDGRHALLGVSAGFLAEVLVAGARTGVSGVARYHAGAATTLAHPPVFPGRVRVDGALVFEGDASLVNVGGGRYRAAGMLYLMPRAVLDDGLLDVCVVAAMPADELMGFVPAVQTGQHLGDPHVTYVTGRHVVIESTDGLPLVAESDGDIIDDPSAVLTVEIVTGAVGVLAPRETVAG